MAKMRFGIRDVLLLMIIVGVGLAWWLDRRQLAGELAALRHAGAVNARRTGSGFPGSFDYPIQHPVSTLTANQFINALHNIDDWYEFSDETVDPFVKTPAADEAVPALIALLNSPSEEVRTRSIATLGRMGRHMETILPALIPRLADESTNVRWHAAFAIGMYGPKAAAAKEALRTQMDDPTSPIAAFSASMLKQIDPSIEVDPILIRFVGNPVLENRKRAVSHLIRAKTTSDEAKAALVEAFGRETDQETRDQMATLIADINARQQPLEPDAAKAIADQPAETFKPVTVELHGGLGQKDRRIITALIDSLNAIEGVRVNVRDADSPNPVTEATVSDPAQLFARESGPMLQESKCRAAIASALAKGGVTTIHWNEGEDSAE
jgi:hypothetical protein